MVDPQTGHDGGDSLGIAVLGPPRVDGDDGGRPAAHGTVLRVLRDPLRRPAQDQAARVAGETNRTG